MSVKFAKCQYHIRKSINIHINTMIQCSSSCSLHLTYIYHPSANLDSKYFMSVCNCAFLSTYKVSSPQICPFRFMAGGEKVLLEGLKFSPRFVDAHCTQRGRALPFCVHHSGDHRCNPSACIILRVLCLLTDMHPSKMKTIQVSSRGSCKSAPNA